MAPIFNSTDARMGYFDVQFAAAQLIGTATYLSHPTFAARASTSRSGPIADSCTATNDVHRLQ
jgi:hypothetical protein